MKSIDKDIAEMNAEAKKGQYQSIVIPLIDGKGNCHVSNIIKAIEEGRGYLATGVCNVVDEPRHVGINWEVGNWSATMKAHPI